MLRRETAGLELDRTLKLLSKGEYGGHKKINLGNYGILCCSDVLQLVIEATIHKSIM